MGNSYVIPITKVIGANRKVTQQVGGTNHEQSTSLMATTRTETTRVSTSSMAAAMGIAEWQKKTMRVLPSVHTICPVSKLMQETFGYL